MNTATNRSEVQFWDVDFEPGFVRITLTSDKPNYWVGKYFINGKGWKHRSIEWCWNGADVVERVDYLHSAGGGIECVTDVQRQVCAVDLLEVETCSRDGATVLVPRWTNARSGRRDYGADAMGY